MYGYFSHTNIFKGTVNILVKDQHFLSLNGHFQHHLWPHLYKLGWPNNLKSLLKCLVGVKYAYTKIMYSIQTASLDFLLKIQIFFTKKYKKINRTHAHPRSYMYLPVYQYTSNCHVKGLFCSIGKQNMQHKEEIEGQHPVLLIKKNVK